MCRVDRVSKLMGQIKALSTAAWEGECEGPVVTEWLDQFDGGSGVDVDDERYQMLFLLCNFLYFGTREIRELLRSVYRDLFRGPLIRKLRAANDDTLDESLLGRLFEVELRRTRFLPIGNPSESSAHLLYYFRQENILPREYFISPHEVWGASRAELRDPTICRYVFLDDFGGTGDQALEYSRDIVSPLSAVDDRLEVVYFVLFATTDALVRIRDEGGFKRVDCVFELGEEFRAFSDGSLFYSYTEEGISKEQGRHVAEYYGRKLGIDEPLGYGAGELILGFSHNVPDNTLPIFWGDRIAGLEWIAPFPRFPKFFASEERRWLGVRNEGTEAGG